MTNDSTTRRHFLKMTGATTTASLLVGSTKRLAGESKLAADHHRYKKAVKIDMVKIEGALVDKFRLLKRIGFDGVELNSPNPLDRDQVLRARDEADFVIHGVIDSTHWKTTLSHPDVKIREQGAKDLKMAVRDAEKYGATSVLLVPAVVNKEATYQQAWDRSQSEIRKVIPLAQDLGIRILFENVWNDFLTDPFETAKYIDQFDSDVVGAYLDMGNAVRYALPSEWIRILGKRIVKIDIKEYSLAKAKEKGQSAGFDVKLQDGDCHWPAVMEELKKIGFHGWGTAEVPGGGEVRLREIAERMDRIFAS